MGRRRISVIARRFFGLQDLSLYLDGTPVRCHHCGDIRPDSTDLTAYSGEKRWQLHRLVFPHPRQTSR